MHHLDFNKMHGGKDYEELHKNATCCFEQIPEVTTHKTAAVRSLTSHRKSHPSKMNKTRRAVLKVTFYHGPLPIDVSMLADHLGLTSALRAHWIKSGRHTKSDRW